MSAYRCDHCRNKKGTYFPQYIDSEGSERRIRIEYVHCAKRMTRQKLKEWESCFDYDELKEV